MKSSRRGCGGRSDSVESEEAKGASSSLRDLAEAAIVNGFLDDMMEGGDRRQSEATWCIRTKCYGDDTAARTAEAGASLARERETPLEMSPLFERLGGEVCTKRLDVQLNVLEGLLRGRGGGRERGGA